MPGKTGLSLLSDIKSISSTTPVIMITKNEAEDIMNEAIASEISDYLIKVKRPDLLKRLVEQPKTKSKNAPKWLAEQRKKRPVNSKINFDKNKKRGK